MELSIRALAEHSAVQLAAEELSRYLSLGCGEALTASEATVITLAVEPEEGKGDGYRIDVDWQGTGNRICGTNERSVLFGAYRLLNELGFKWIRPGAAGEVIPALQWGALPAVHVASSAGYEFRGICIEGAVSEENVLETVEWMSRHGMNAYFIQFRDAYTFYERWYAHTSNPLLPAEPFEAEAITAKLRAEVKRRGMELQMVGHGWTCEPFGIPGKGWYVHKEPIAPEITKFFAEVKGKRELWGGVALNTSLCYGNPEVRKLMTDAIVTYARENPDVDVIHFWLADGSNNNCECGLCSVKRPSDWYVDMLNELDDKLSAAGLSVRIVFLVYVDLLWAPQVSRLHQSPRFILMFAPITRTYSRPFMPGEPVEGPLPEYVRNKLKMPSSPALNVAFLNSWFEQFDGASFDFDYHYMWDHQRDAGYYDIARILQEDCRNLAKLHLNGMVSCQNQRVFFPNGLGMNAMARTLWEPGLTFETIAAEFFRDAYGAEYAAEAQWYFKRNSEIFRPELLRGEKPLEERKQVAQTLEADFEAAVAEVQPALAAGKALPMAAQRESWEQLEMHIERNRLLAKMLVVLWTKGKAAAAEAAEALRAWAREHEMRLQKDFDVFEYITVINHRILNAAGLEE